MQPQSEPGLAAGLALEPGGPVAAATRAIRVLGAPVAVVVASLAWILGRGIDHRFISFSDGAYMYSASEAAAHGFHTLYRTVALSLPPAPVLGAVLVWRASPHVEAIRLVLGLLSVITALLTYRAARTLVGLNTRWAVAASLLALTAPVHAQFVGLDGEAVLTPLALVLALTLERRRTAWSLVVMAAGFLVKLTWVPFFLAGLLVLVPRVGRRKAAFGGACALAGAFAAYAGAVWAFGWSAHDLLEQLVFAEAHSGSQFRLIPGLVSALVVLWWPLVALAPTGLAHATRPTRYVTAAGAVCALYMLKQGTFFNVLDPLEPFLALLATAGACMLWRRRSRWSRPVVVICAVGVMIHIASVTSASVSRALPIPVGAAIVNTDNESVVNRLARAVDAHSTRRQPVLVNPLVALVARRREAADASDWFILHALGSYCRAERRHGDHCDDWRVAKVMARSGRVAVVSVDSNVVSFDHSFRRDVRLNKLHRVVRVDSPPVKTSIYVRR